VDSTSRRVALAPPPPSVRPTRHDPRVYRSLQRGREGPSSAPNRSKSTVPALLRRFCGSRNRRTALVGRTSRSCGVSYLRGGWRGDYSSTNSILFHLTLPCALLSTSLVFSLLSSHHVPYRGLSHVHSHALTSFLRDKTATLNDVSLDLTVQSRNASSSHRNRCICSLNRRPLHVPRCLVRNEICKTQPLPSARSPGTGPATGNLIKRPCKYDRSASSIGCDIPRSLS